MDINVSPEDPQSPSSWRTVLEWVLLGGAMLGYGIVYLGAAYASPVVFAAGLALSALITAGAMYLHFSAKGLPPAPGPTAVPGQFDLPVFFARVRRLLAIIRSAFR